MKLLGTIILFCLAAFPAQAADVQEVTSAHGIKAWLVEEHALPLIAVNIAFTGSGAAYDLPGKDGRGGMVAALLMEGAGDMDSQVFNEALESHAVRLTFSVDEDVFQAQFEALSGQKDNAFYYAGLALTHPHFDEGAIERVKSQSLSVLAQQEKEPGYLLHRDWQALAFPGHPYGNALIGTAAGLQALEKQDLADFAHRYLTRENMVIAVVGDITPDELGRLLDAHLLNLPEHYDPDMGVPDITLPEASKQIITQFDIPQTLVTFGTNGVGRNDPDYYAAYVMNQILGGPTLSTRLADEIREKRGLAYSVYSHIDAMDHAAVWQGGFSTRNEKVQAAVDTLHATLKDFAQNGPSDREMQNAKQYLTGSFMLGLDSNASIADYLIHMQRFHLGRNYLARRNQLISAVTKDQVKRLASRIADPDHLLVVMVGKPDSKN